MSIKSMNMPTMDELVSFRREFITQFDSRQTPFLLLLFRPVNLHTLLSLNAKELWFSHPQDFNDPFDCSKVIHLYKGSTDYTSVLHEIRIRSFANINNINNMLLWSHYADGHKGIAITIAPNYPLLKKNNIVLSPIYYDYSPLKTPYHGGGEVLIDTFLSKSSIWKYEQEYRLITLAPYLNNGNILKADRCSPYFSITNITFGLKCPLKYRNLIKSIISSNFSEMKKIKTSTGQYQLQQTSASTI